ncbi:MAG TPA: type IV toxin-antitoxin system AbiEi family antitoxin domain-containing protein [Solirubrobacteraceae bacterium]|nr:type IV toxin-antitoxin system AbiEi family antitoxin domain-containing protein [Solirubrobacteraceae bacterium]
MPAETTLEPAMGAERRARHVDAAIAALAGRQHGVVARAQLADLGLRRRAIGHRLDCGRLHPVHRGVYAVGHRALSRESAWMAAVLAGGPGAVLSHRSAAALWGVRDTSRTRAEVVVPRARRSRARLEFHLVVLPPDEVTVWRGIPVTTPPRTLLDLAAVVPRRQLARAVDEAEVRRLTDRLSLADLVARYPGRRGVGALRRLLDEGRVGLTITRSELEERFLAFLAGAGLPRPAVNVPLQLAGAWVEADCVWHRARLVVELAGYAAHGTRSAFERDRARDRMLQAAGWRVVRITWRQLRDEPRAIAAELRVLLSRGAAAAAAETAV